MRPYLIGIAGPSCAGKTQLARRLAQQFSATILPLDNYYHDLSGLSLQERARFNFDLPDALDHALFADHVRALAEGRVIERPVYDFATHARTGQVERVEPAEFVIVEGLFVLYWPDVRRHCSTRVFVALGDRVCLERRTARDVRERGRTAESVLKQFTETVAPMADAFVRPTAQYADLVIPGDNDPEASAAAVLAHVKSVRTAQVSCS